MKEIYILAIFMVSCMVLNFFINHIFAESQKRLNDFEEEFDISTKSPTAEQ